MRKNRRQIQRLRKSLPISSLLVGLLSASLLPAASFGQQATNDTERLKPVVVTGSLIPTAETVGASAVEVLNSVDIEKVGSTDVLETLKKVSSSFSGNGNVGQTVNNGGGGEAYIAIRNLPTLVLVNGRRLANSAFSNGALVDLNTIPLAMIDRIEVLKDGASALYGSDAIGGVVNIITKKDFTGVDIGGRYGFATGKGSVTEQRASVVAGTATENSSFVAGAQYYAMDPLLSKDRDVSSAGISELLAKGLFPPTYVSPSFPGRVQSGGVSYVLAGSPFAVGSPGYNPAITAPPVTRGKSYTTVPAYLADHPGIYVPISETSIGKQLAAVGIGEAQGWPLLNTPLLGTHSIQSQDRRQAFASGSHQLYGKEVELFGDFLFANTESRGVLAASPMPALTIAANVTIEADSPINPFQIKLGKNGAGSPRVRTRFNEVGNRLFDNQSDYYHIIGGLRGQLDNEYVESYELAYNYNRNDQIQFTRNAPNGVALEQATTPNPDPAKAAAGLSALTDASGAVPLFNPFALPGANDARTIDALRTTGFQSGLSELWGADGHVNGRLFELPAGKVSYAIGGGFYTENFATDFDGITKLAQLVGLNRSFPTEPGRRDAWSGFIETRIPITGPDYSFPGGHSIEITAAGRYETFDPGGDSAVPKFGVRWQPIDEQVTIRGTYSQSFLAPNVFQLFGAPLISSDTVNAGGIGQVQMNWTSSRDLRPADAENYGAGIVVTPRVVEGLTVSLDYYHVQTDNDIFRVGAQAVADSLNQFGASSEFARDFYFDTGAQLTSNAPNQVTVANWGSGGRPLRNGAEVETDGLDLRADYLLPFDTAGRINVYAASTVLFNYKYADPLIGGPFEYGGQFTENGPAGGDQGSLPDFIINTGLSWSIADFTYSVNARYIPEIDDLGDMHASVGSAENGFTQSGEKWVIPDYYTIDMQLAYEIGKGRTDKRWYDGTRLAIGCNNITDNLPPFIASAGEDNTDKSIYDILGRFVYFEVSKKF